MKNAWPVKAMGFGGRHYRFADDGQPFVDQNFDSYGVEYTFADGTKFIFDGRYMVGTEIQYTSQIHGTTGFTIASKSGDCGAPSSIYKGLSEDRDKKIWQSSDRSAPYQNEWNDLIDAIVNDKPYNEVKRGVEASIVCSMGRASAHIGQEVTFDQMLNSEHEFAPDIDHITKDSPSPLPFDEKGLVPVAK